MIIVKRKLGAITAILLAGAGQISVAPPASPTPVKPDAKGKKGKSADKSGTKSETKPGTQSGTGTPLPRPPRDASPGAKLAFKLHHAITIADEKERSVACYKLGKLANEIGPGDPDVAAAHQRARADQASFRANPNEIDIVGRECVEGSEGAFTSWSAAFLAGYIAKAPAKGTATPKPYLLTVHIEGTQPHEGKSLDSTPPEDHTGKFATFGDAHRAAVRWFTLKSDVAHRMSVVIDTIDMSVPLVPGEPPAVVENLRYEVSLAEARNAANAARRRQDRGPIMFAPKVGGRTLGFGVKVKESRCEFSRG